ncbi:uncharacterized protein [Rutidosis leptorrhynchoides]|uniref:uncharacterized protein n=1 Tax=Rutidosis leptorrhynchoides TaxID=125765 RepID=UPI003A990E85
MWGDLSTIALDRKLSDHCPILLRDKIVDFRPKPIRVFDTWLDIPGANKVMEDALNYEVERYRPDLVLMRKLKNVKQALKTLSSNALGSLDAEINELKKKVLEWELKAERYVLNEDDRNQWLFSRSQWIEKDAVKRRMLIQKARIKWSLDGDENIKIFHSDIKIRESKNNIRGIIVNGCCQEEADVIKNEVFIFYKSLFVETGTDRPTFDGPFPNCLSTDDASILEIPFTELEVLDAIKDCGGSKAPGPDDFNFNFFKKFWPLIKSDLLRAIDWFWEREDPSFILIDGDDDDGWWCCRPKIEKGRREQN